MEVGILANITIHYDAASRHVTVDYSALEKSVRSPRRSSALGRVAAWFTPFALACGFGAVGCDGSNGDDTDTCTTCDVGDDGDDSDADVPTDSDGTDGGNLPPNPIDGTHVLPSDSRVYNVGDLVPVVIPTVPSDPEGDSLTGDATLYGDTDGVPGESAGDARATVDLGTLVAGGSASGEINTGTAGAGGTALPGTPDGQQYTLTINVNDTQGGKSSLTRTIYLKGGNRVRYCRVDNAHSDSTLTAQCYAADDAGNYSDGEWEIECDIAGGCGAMPTGEIGSLRVMDASDVNIHDIRVRARRNASSTWTPWYDLHVMIDYSEGEVGINTPTGSVQIRGPPDYISTIARCFPEFNPTSIPQNTGDPDHGGERNTTANGQAETTTMYNCVRDAINTNTTPDQQPLLVDLRYAEGRTPPERIVGINPDTVSLVQFLFSKSM